MNGVQFGTLGIYVLAVFIGFPLYFLPAYMAARRDCPNKKRLLLLNLLLGWTLVAWGYVLVRALSYRAPQTAEEEQQTEEL